MRVRVRVSVSGLRPRATVTWPSVSAGAGLAKPAPPHAGFAAAGAALAPPHAGFAAGLLSAAAMAPPGFFPHADMLRGGGGW